jgi:ABC-type Fe3+ transport system permease subunit
MVKGHTSALIVRPVSIGALATTAFQMAMDEQIVASSSAALLLIGTGALPVALLDRLVGRRGGSA